MVAQPRNARLKRGATLLVATLTIGIFAPSNSQAATHDGPSISARTENTLRLVGRITETPSYVTQSGLGVPGHPTPMIVDAEHNLGFMFGSFNHVMTEGNLRTYLVMYDLETLERLDAIPIDTAEGAETILSWTVDETETRLLAFPGQNLASPTCGVGGGQFLDVRDYGRDGGTWKFVEHTFIPVPCGSPLAVSGDAASVHVDPTSGEAMLYMTGTYGYDSWREVAVAVPTNPDTRDNVGSPLLVRQIDIETLATDPEEAVDWQIDLSKYGCGRKVTPFVARADDSVYSYCHDANAEASVSAGQQGFLVRIPLDEQNMPQRTNDDLLAQILDELPTEVREHTPEDPTEEFPPEAFAALPNEVLDAAVRRVPTLPGFAQPFLDPGTGRIMLLTDDNVNGNAVWVFDPIAERFIGVMAPGDTPPPQRQARPDDPEPSPGGAGFNPELGRAYLYAEDGIVVASGRQDPPMAGTLYRILGKDTHRLQKKPGDRASRPMIAVAPELGRLFVPVEGVGYIVLEDTTLDPPLATDDNLDRLTTQVDERAGLTEATTLSEAEASGLHVVMAGGTSNVVNPLNPLCAPPALGDRENPDHILADVNIFLEDNTERAIFDGSCLAERFVSRGHRDSSLGYTATNGGTGTGVEALGQGVAFAPGDSATDHDLRNAGECYRSSLHASATDVSDHFSGDNENARAPFDAIFAPSTGEGDPGGGPYRRLCNEPQEGIREHDDGRTPDLNTGTQGRDGDGFPAPQARCSDATNDTDQRDTAGVFRSEARCDGSQILGQASSASVGIGFTGTADPTITVEEVSSSVDTRRTPDEGTVTVAHARADGVQIGPLHIGTVWSRATAKAHGRNDTAHGVLERAWCDVSVNGEQLFEECEDPDDSEDVQEVIDAFNQAFQKVRLSVPPAEAEGTPGGYQGVVIKDPTVAAADQTVNEDDSLTVPALQATFYNDNAEGRSRTILQFAGVRSESSYGIILLPQFDTPEFGPIGEFTSGAAPTFSSLPINRPVYGQEARPPRFTEQLIAGQRPAPPENTFRQAVRNPVAAALQAFEWLRQHPREAALLFLVFSILGLPVYLIVRRRTFERALLD